MERHIIRVTAEADAAVRTCTASASPSLLSRVALSPDQTCPLRFGLAKELVQWRAEEGLGDDELRLSRPLADRLRLQTPLSLTLFRPAPDQVALGPLVGLLIAGTKLAAVQDGLNDHIYCRYAVAAREAGILLLFFAAEGLDLARGTLHGYLHHCEGAGQCQWIPLQAAIPRVIYDRSFGQPARTAAAELRRATNELGVVVVNRPIKITKLQAFDALRPPGDLAPHIPLTLPLSLELLTSLVDHYDDLYLKPDSLYKGKGVCRLMRQGSGWTLQTRAEGGNQSILIPTKADFADALAELLMPDLPYVVQEGLPLATYLGNRFDLRSLVQRDGSGAWRVSGVVARIAPTGSVITSPRSGGQIAAVDSALEHAFGPRASQIRREIDRVSLAHAERIDQHLGPCAELGLDLGVLEDGSIKLIEVNGIPLRVSLDRLNDPMVGEQIERLPIHFAAYLDTKR